MMNRIILPAARIAAAIAVVVVPFGYAITGLHTDVLMGVGCGIGVGVGVGLRGGAGSGPWTGIVVGSIVGITAALIRGLAAWDGFAVLVPPVLALALGLTCGLRGSSLSGYREMSRETLIASVPLALGLLPVLAASDNLQFALAPLLCVPWIALMGGLLSQRREGWQDSRPPRLLVLGSLALFALLFFLMFSELVQGGFLTLEIAPVARAVGLIVLLLVAVPAGAFLLGRTVITWLLPRLRVYGHLADYLRVMWVPIGGFAVGYLTIIVLFAGFYGMLGRFSPGAFSDGGTGTGIADWLFFSFFTALGQDFLTVSPDSVGARVLVGVHLILSAGWVVVLFAAVMTSIGPKLERIARRQGEE